MTEIAKKTSSDFSRVFDFLTKDFGLKMNSESYSGIGENMYVRSLRNKFVQVEIAGDQHYFHCEIRRLIDGETRPYHDGENNIGFESLAVLQSNNNYNHMDYYVASVGWEKVLANTVELLKGSRDIFTSDVWVDTARIEKLKDEEFEKKFGSKPKNDRPTFFGLIRKRVPELLSNKGYVQTFDNSDFPPYNSDRLTQKLSFQKGDSTVTVSQRDWRDFYTCYFVEINGRRLLDIDTTKYDDVKIPVDMTLSAIDERT